METYLFGFTNSSGFNARNAIVDSRRGAVCGGVVAGAPEGEFFEFSPDMSVQEGKRRRDHKPAAQAKPPPTAYAWKARKK